MPDENSKKITAPFHFLMNCSEVALGAFQNMKLNEAANAQKNCMKI
jgi:hypothetical protein